MKSRFYFCLLLIVLLSGLTAAPVAAQYGRLISRSSTLDDVDDEYDEDEMESMDMEDEGSPEPEYAYPPAWNFAENRRPQVQAEERVTAPSARRR